MACEQEVAEGHHYPTDDTLLGDGIRVLSRSLRRIDAHCKRGAIGSRESRRIPVMHPHHSADSPHLHRQDRSVLHQSGLVSTRCRALGAILPTLFRSPAGPREFIGRNSGIQEAKFKTRGFATAFSY
jgi:hypothetical protein